MDDAHILAVEGRRVHLLQLGGGLGHQLAGHPAPAVQLIAAHHCGGGAVAVPSGRVDDLIALLDLVAGHGVQRQAHIGAVPVGDLQHHVIDGRQIQHIGHGGIVAVLRQLLGNVTDGDTAAVGGHTLGQRRQRLVEGAELTPLHGLAAAHGQALGGRELVVYQLGPRVLQQLHAVVGFHLGAETAGGLGVHLPCEHLQIHVFHISPPCFFRIGSSPRPVPACGSPPAPGWSGFWDRCGSRYGCRPGSPPPGCRRRRWPGPSRCGSFPPRSP